MHRVKAGLLKDQGGFTLVELLVVVAIIAILSAFALPAYKRHVTKSNRVDGQAALLMAAQQVERFRTTGMTYEDADLEPDFVATSEQGFYTLVLTNDTADTYILTATGVGPQATDSGCTPMTLNQAGVKGPAACW